MFWMARPIFHFSCLFALVLACGSQVAAASAPSVVADGQIALASGFQLPEGVAVSSNGTIYVADTGNNRVVTVSTAGVVTAVNITGYTLSGPGAVATDAAGDLFIADSKNSRVLELTTAGNVVLVASAPTLSYPASFAFDPAGDLFIGDPVNYAVYKVAASGLASGQPAATAVNIANLTNLFPGALAFDPAGDLFIADGNSNNVYKLPSGQSIATPITFSGFTLNTPSGLAIDAVGNLFVLDSGNARIIETPLSSGATPYMVPASGLAVPSSLALDPQGNLYVTDVTNSNLTELVYSGNPINLGQIPVGSAGTAATINYELNTPETLSAFQVFLQGDVSSEVSIGSGTTCQFQAYSYSPAGSSNPITATNPFNCVAQVQGTPSVSGLRTGTINLLGIASAPLLGVPFSEVGVASSAWIAPGVATTLVSGFSAPEGIAVSGLDKTVYIADAGNAQVYSWAGLTVPNASLTPVSTSPIALIQPSDVAVDGAGDLFIADAGDLSANGRLGKIVVVPANSAIQPYILATGSVLYHPTTIVFDGSGNLFIGDGGPNPQGLGSAGLVAKIPPSGAPITVLNTSSPGLSFPQEVTTDTKGNLYIADGGPYLGDGLGFGAGQILFVPQGGATASKLNIPNVVNPLAAADAAGNLWIEDPTYPNQFTVVPLNGGTSFTVPLRAPAPPNSMRFTADGKNLLFADFTHQALVMISGLQAQLSFPTTAVGSQSSAQTADIVSTGNSALLPTSPGGNLYSFAGNTQDFQLQSGSSCLSFTQLTPGQSCALSASFAPVTEGTESETVTSIFNSSAQVQLSLLGSTTNASTTAASPIFSPASGTYTTAQTVTITDTTAGAVIHYTTNGTIPTAASTVYSSAVTVTTPETINAIAIASGYTNSPVATAIYGFPATATPSITLATGTYVMPTSTTITDATSGASIQWCYIASGTCTPATSYTASIYVNPATSETICANATASAHAPSATACATYTSGTATATPAITLATGTYVVPTSTTITDTTSGASISWCYVSSGTCTPSVAYSGSVSITASEVVCANAIATGHALSATACTTYTGGTAAATPVITRPVGIYVMPTSTTITDSTSGASILYCTVASGTCTPATAYSASIAISTTETICSTATASGYAKSATACSTYTSGTATATPVITLAAGNYTLPTSTTVTDSTSGASILYCTVTSGTCTPSTAYSTTITISVAETICASATATGYAQSATACNAYTTGAVTATPVITLPTGIYVMPQNTTITDSTSGASILWCYIASGTCTPATAYTASIYINPATAETICASATATGYTQSTTACATYTSGTATAQPTFSLAAGNYTLPTSTTISDTTSGAVILYCTFTTGSSCTPATTYSSSITISSAETICANATASGHATSTLACNTYTTGTPAATPSFSLATGTYVMPQNTTITDSTSGASIQWCYITGGSSCTPATSYTGSIYINTSSYETICANATASGYIQSATACRTYTKQ